MINFILRWCLHNRLVVLGATALLMHFGWRAMVAVPVDAMPDIGELQVIVYADWPGRSPQDMEDQVIYPLTTSLMGIPKVKVVRSSSNFGFGMVNIIFQDRTDFYWARTRVLERLNLAQRNMPEGVTPVLGPDATALGQIFWYTVENGWFCPDHPHGIWRSVPRGEGEAPEYFGKRSDAPPETALEQVRFAMEGTCPIDGNPLQHSGLDLGQLRSLQDWYIRFQLNGVAGVSEVATVGGYVQQYQIEVDPDALSGHDIPVGHVAMAVRRSNLDVGAQVVEEGQVEYVVRGVGFIESLDDIRSIVVKATSSGTPVRIGDVANVTLGPDFRRGILDKAGVPAVGGVALMRHGENPLAVIERLEVKAAELEAGLPPGVRIEPFYDRSEIVRRAQSTLNDALVTALIVTLVVVLLFLGDPRTSLIICSVLPASILIGFLLMKLVGMPSNIMSLGGIAIAIGVMVDAGIVVCENMYRHLSERRDECRGDAKKRLQVAFEGAKQVAGPIFFALLIIIVAFIPVFSLTGQAGRLFIPLAFTKTFVMAGAALLAITLLPVLASLLLRGWLPRPESNPLTWVQTRLLLGIYRPVIQFSLLAGPIVVPLIVVGLVAIAVVTYPKISSEFMPPLNEGDLLYMPVLQPGVSLTEAGDILQTQDRLIASIPEVAQVVGKSGRAETATDPAPILMFETIIRLNPPETWRPGVTRQDIIDEIVALTRMPGLSPIMTQPIQNRIDMLATGIQTPVGIKVFGDDLSTIERIAIQIEEVAKGVQGAVGPYAERIGSRPYLEIDIDRDAIARHGLTIEDVQSVIMTSLGGMNISWTVEGRERYPIRIRYPRELRDSLDDIRRILVPAPRGAQIPLGQLARIERTLGPSMISSENTRTYARVFISVNTDEVGVVDFVDELQQRLDEEVRPNLPPGHYYTISGQYEAELESRARLSMVLPICLTMILFLLYLKFQSIADAILLFSALPFALTGGLLLQSWLGFKFSTAVWVGYIALFGVAVEDGIVMLEYLRERAGEATDNLRQAIVEGAVLRVRPIMMTTMTTILALLPIFILFDFSDGWIPAMSANHRPGTEIMQPIAAPTIGGMVTATLTNLILVPVAFYWLESLRRRFRKGSRTEAAGGAR
jgi:Cu(I)/Ag(I) efflux system membrane protein CusA/SilA